MIQRFFDFSDIFPARLRQILTVFFGLQILDILTTLVGFRYGAQESSIFVARLLQFGPVAGLLVSKAIAVLLAIVAIQFERERLVRFVNLWFTAVVGWNLLVILKASSALG